MDTQRGCFWAGHRTLQRPYSVNQVKAAAARAISNGFRCVNADFIFALPDQTYGEVKEAGRTLVQMGFDQVAAYPLFKFPYTRWAQMAKTRDHKTGSLFRRRKMLGILEKMFYDAGFERTSVWAFTRRGVPKYCSVTVPLYVGLGASGGSYLKDIFYLNTFNVLWAPHSRLPGQREWFCKLRKSEKSLRSRLASGPPSAPPRSRRCSCHWPSRRWRQGSCSCSAGASGNRQAGHEVITQNALVMLSKAKHLGVRRRLFAALRVTFAVLRKRVVSL